MKRAIAILLAVVIVAMTFSSCGKAAISESGDEGYTPSVDINAEDAKQGTGDKSVAATGRKIIEKYYYMVETRSFDELMSSIKMSVSSAGGYIESSSISGNSSDLSGKGRTASISVRIPVERMAEFGSFISENCAIIKESINTDDVTLNYVDAESRLAALRIEKASIEKLLASATDMSSIVLVYERLTQIIYEIESYEATLRTYDNLVDYATVSLDITEVEHTAVGSGNSVWQRIGSNLSGNFQSIGRFFENAFVWVASALPYIVMLAALTLCTIVIIKRKAAKRAGATRMTEQQNIKTGE